MPRPRRKAAEEGLDKILSHSRNKEGDEVGLAVPLENSSASEETPLKKKNITAQGSALKTHASRTGHQYRKIGDYTLLSAGIYSIDEWIKSTDEARPIKRSVKGRSKSKETDVKFSIPPVDILKVSKKTIYTDKDNMFQCEQRTIVGPNPNHENLEKVKVQLKFNDFCMDIPADGNVHALKTEESLVFALNTGCEAGASAADWMALSSGDLLFACSAYGRSPNTDYPLSVNVSSSPGIQLWSIFVTDGSLASCLLTTIEHEHGLVRQIAFLASKCMMAVLYGDGLVILYSLRGQIVSTLAEIEEVSLPSRFCWYGEEVDGLSYFVIGTVDGRVFLYTLAASGEVSKVSGTRISSNLVTSLTFCGKDPLLLSIGFHDTPSVLLDFRSPECPAPLQSSLAYTPIVHWSPHVEAWAIADTEQSCRLYPAENVIDRHSLPLSNHSCAVNRIAISPMHSIIATSGIDGSIHLTWPTGGSVCIEKAVLSLVATKNAVTLSEKLSVPIIKKLTTLGEPSQWISHMSWSPSPSSLGLLCICSSQTPLVLFYPVDRLSIL